MNQTSLQKILHFFLVKMAVGAIVVAGTVFFSEWLRILFTGEAGSTGGIANGLITALEIFLAILSYILLFRVYEKRQVTELSAASFLQNAGTGFLLGFGLQALAILTIFLVGGYFIEHINPVSFLVPGFSIALVAGVVVELLVRGLLFRLTEEKLGTTIALIVSSLVFTIAHLGVPGATLLSVITTTLQAGLLTGAVYVYSRSLWLPIFFHFGWDLAEPGIFGGINPGIRIDKSLFTSKISGPEVLTGGAFGPGNSLQAAIFSLVVTVLFLWLAKQKNNFVKPYWKK